MNLKRFWAPLHDEAVFDSSTYTEEDVQFGARLDADSISYSDMLSIRNSLQGCYTNDFLTWIRNAELDSHTAVVDTDDGYSLESLKKNKPELIFNCKGLTHIRHLNTFLNKANEVLPKGGYLWCHSRTAGLKRMVILSAHPGIVGKTIYFMHYMWHNVMSRISLTRWFYMFVTKGQNRSYCRVEILGRMFRAGFEVIDERFEKGEFYVLGRKIKEPIWDDKPTNGLLVKLNRVGRWGKMIGVYKFRTMYPYSEYLQPYLYAHEGLAPGGKFAHDYRVNWLGEKLRGSWLDEFPMLLNVIKGQMKLVGVRPISRQYLSLYTPQMQQLHESVKPGLLPPFYYENVTPQTIEDVQESEKRYIEAYKQHPLATDWHYFWGIIANIVFRRKRSH